jgi:poly(A) polymerase
LSTPPQVIPRDRHTLSRNQIAPEALKTLYRLKEHGFTAYLVGGSVRDLLLGRPPKDFDVGTDAHPREMKKLFRNCRLIGRRFRLAHLLFKDRIIEVATFRDQSVPAQEEIGDLVPPAEAEFERPMRELLITRDNTFGTPETDALRRDFTINGLFYDIATFSLIDYVGGMRDLRDQVIRCIGDPDIRFREDPVRMLRAVKFAARLGFRIEEGTYRGILAHREEIAKASPPRVFEEITRLLQSGASAEAFRLLDEMGLLPLLIPSVGEWIARQHAAFEQTSLYRRLACLDQFRKREESITNALAFGVLLALPVLEALGKLAPLPPWGFGPASAIPGAVEAVLPSLPLPRKDRERIVQIYLAQRHFFPGKGRRPQLFLRKPYFPEAWQFFKLTAEAEGQMGDLVKQWESLPPAQRLPSPQAGEEERGEGSRRRRRRRRRKPRHPLSPGGEVQKGAP